MKIRDYIQHQLNKAQIYLIAAYNNVTKENLIQYSKWAAKGGLNTLADLLIALAITTAGAITSEWTLVAMRNIFMPSTRSVMSYVINAISFIAALPVVSYTKYFIENFRANVGLKTEEQKNALIIEDKLAKSEKVANEQENFIRAVNNLDQEIRDKKISDLPTVSARLRDIQEAFVQKNEIMPEAPVVHKRNISFTELLNNPLQAVNNAAKKPTPTYSYIGAGNKMELAGGRLTSPLGAGLRSTTTAHGGRGGGKTTTSGRSANKEGVVPPR